MTVPPPPRSLSLFIEVLGFDDTLRLVEAHGGTRLWIPSGVGNSSRAARERLEEEFGKPMTRELIAGFGGDFIQVPLCKPWRILLYRERGMTQRQIARMLRCHVDTVKKAQARAAGDDAQAKFPF